MIRVVAHLFNWNGKNTSIVSSAFVLSFLRFKLNAERLCPLIMTINKTSGRQSCVFLTHDWSISCNTSDEATIRVGWQHDVRQAVVTGCHQLLYTFPTYASWPTVAVVCIRLPVYAFPWGRVIGTKAWWVYIYTYWTSYEVIAKMENTDIWT